MDALKMHFLLKMGIFQPVMFVYQRISRWQFNQFSLVFQCLALQVQDPGPRWSLVFLNEEPGRRANGDWWRIWWHLSLWWFWFCNSSCKNGLDLKPHFPVSISVQFSGVEVQQTLVEHHAGFEHVWMFTPNEETFQFDSVSSTVGTRAWQQWPCVHFLTWYYLWYFMMFILKSKSSLQIMACSLKYRITCDCDLTIRWWLQVERVFPARFFPHLPKRSQVLPVAGCIVNHPRLRMAMDVVQQAQIQMCSLCVCWWSKFKSTCCL